MAGAKGLAGGKPGRDARDGVAFLVFAAVFLSAQIAALHIMGALAPVPLYLAVALLPDFLIGLCAFCFLVSFQRPRLAAFVACALVASMIVVASSLKFAVLGQPIYVDDLFLIGDLLVASRPAEQLLVLAVPAALLVLLVANFRLRAPPPLATVVLLLLVGSAITARLHPAASRALVEIAPPRLSSLPMFGHFVTAWTHFVENTQHDHAMNGPREELPFGLIADAPEGIIGARRNVYFILLESFVDPTSFPAFSWSREPLTDLFARWRREVRSVSVSPVFANGSTNADFEVMCGLPTAVGGSTIVFQHIREGMRLPCLPDFLARHGYRTFSIVAEPPSFLNSDAARRGMGFQRTIFAPELDMSDRDDIWLSAEAMFRQASQFNAEMRGGGVKPRSFPMSS